MTNKSVRWKPFERGSKARYVTKILDFQNCTYFKSLCCYFSLLLSGQVTYSEGLQLKWLMLIKQLNTQVWLLEAVYQTWQMLVILMQEVLIFFCFNKFTRLFSQDICHMYNMLLDILFFLSQRVPRCCAIWSRLYV